MIDPLRSDALPDEQADDQTPPEDAAAGARGAAASPAGSPGDADADETPLLRQAYGLDDAGVAARRAVLAAAAQVAAGGVETLDEKRLAEVAAALADADVALAAADALAAAEPVRPDALAAVASAAAEASGDAAAGAAYVRGRCAEHAGHAGDAETHLAAALEADPQFVPALLEAACFAEDRGEAHSAMLLLRRAGVGDDDAQLVRVQAWAVPPPAQRQARRNDPCPCGSGRKFKACCATRQGHPLEARAGWLLDKAERYAARARHRRRLLPLVEARAGDARDSQRLAAAIRDPLIADLGLFDAGLLADFLAERGELLPADERELAGGWHNVERGCYEVAADGAGGKLELVDLRGGEQVAAWPGPDSRDLQPGETVFARVVPAGGAHLLAGGAVRVPAERRRGLLALLDSGAGAACQAAWVAALEAASQGAPGLVTADGEPLVVCQTTYRLGDVEAACQALSARFEAIGQRRWVEPAEVEGRRWIHGTLSVHGDRLRVEANSVARAEGLEAAVAALAGDASLVERTRRGGDEILGGGTDDATATA